MARKRSVPSRLSVVFPLAVLGVMVLSACGTTNSAETQILARATDETPTPASGAPLVLTPSPTLRPAPISASEETPTRPARSETPSPTPSPTPNETLTPAPEETAVPSTPQGTPSPTLASEATLTPTPSPTHEETPTPGPEATLTPAPEPEEIPSPALTSLSVVASNPSAYDGETVELSGQAYLTGSPPRLLIDGKAGINLTGNTSVIQKGFYRLTGV